MKRSQFRSEINNRLGPILVRARVRNGSSIATVAQSLGLSESEMSEIERRPGEIPCCRLYEVIRLYGAEAHWETQEALLDIQHLGFQYRMKKRWLNKVVNILNREFRQARRIIFKVLTVKLSTAWWKSTSLRSFISNKD